MITRDDIQRWVEEQLAEVNESGAASAVTLGHYAATGLETEILAMRSGAPKWNKADEMADVFYTVATRHAQGLTGHQQFRMNCFFGGSNKPSRYLPFGIAGLVQFGPIPGGGLATESPNGVGITSQNLRHQEILSQGYFSGIKHTSDTMAAIIADLRRALESSQTEVRELWVAIKDIITRVMEAEKKAQLDVIAAKRNAMLLQELTRLFPALLNGVTGRNIFPIAVEDTSLLRGLNVIISEDQLRGLSVLAQQAGPEAQAQFALFSNRLQQLRKEELEQAKKIEELAGEAVGDDFAAAARNATGQAFATLRRVAAGPDGANGHANGNGAAKVAKVVADVIDNREKINAEVAADVVPGVTGDTGDVSDTIPPPAPTVTGDPDVDLDAACASYGMSFYDASSESDIQSIAMFMRSKGAGAVADRMIQGWEVYKRVKGEAAIPAGAPPGESPAPGPDKPAS